MTTTNKLIQEENKYCAHNYLPIPVMVEKAEGVWVWDVDGKKYIDMMAAYSAVSHGHCHPKILKAMHEQSKKVSVVSRAYHSETLGPFLKRLCEISGYDMVLPMNTGAEAVETAIKAARRWGYQKKGIEDGKANIIVAHNNFHGRTTTIIGFSSEFSYKEGFSPFDGGFKEIPFADAAALENAIDENTCAFLVEPIQGEAGIIVPPPGWLKKVAEICKHHNVLLICDEVQSGMGRTGKMFCYEHDGIQPDGLILGKALGGGVYPVSAFLANRDVMEVFTPGSHGSTFGGNSLAAAIGHAAIDVLIDEKLVENSAKLGAYLLERLRAVRSPVIMGTHGLGLWVGVEIDPQYATARAVCERLAENGFLSKETHETVIRIAPPLTITKEELDHGIEILRETLKEFVGQ